MHHIWMSRWLGLAPHHTSSPFNGSLRFKKFNFLKCRLSMSDAGDEDIDRFLYGDEGISWALMYG